MWCAAIRIASNRRITTGACPKGAEEVRDYLIAQGVAVENIELRAFGHLMSLTSCAQADRGILIACLAPDRSVTVQILPPPR